MQFTTTLRKRGRLAGIAGWLILVALLPVAHARTLTLHVDSLRSTAAAASGLSVSLDWPDGAVSGSLRVDVDAVDASAYGYRFDRVRWQCQLARDGKDGWRCEGEVRADAGKPMRLALAIASASTVARLSDGLGALNVQRIAATPDTTRILFEQVPVAWLQAYATTLWANGRLQKGTLDGRFDARVPVRGPLKLSGSLQLRGFAFETPDGAIAADALDADATLAGSVDASRSDFGTDLTLHGGELLAGGLYAALPKTPVTAILHANRQGQGDWNFDVLRWNDGAVLVADGGARFAPDFGLRAVNLRVRSDDLALARDRYLSGFLGPAGFGDLNLRGGVQAQIAMDANGLQSASVELHGVDAVDGKQRVMVHGLDGDLRWTADATPIASALRWNDGALFGIAFGPARMAMRSASRLLELDGATAVTLLGGTLRLDKLDIAVPGGGKGTRYVLGLTLQKLQVAQLAKVLGWPAFAGTLDGTLPAARYENQVLVFDGGLTAQVFGGALSIDKLALERPFGADPSLSADLAIKGFDLKTLTGAFGFGQITGRLDGHIRDLRLLDWTPIAFDAELHSDDTAPDRRRISQRAVRDLSNIGGGGFIGGLQTQVLHFFSEFGYARLGLACRLADNVCHMDGVGSAGDGYTIVEGSGLPRISVVGFAREVDWPTLVERLKSATQGNITVK